MANTKTIDSVSRIHRTKIHRAFMNPLLRQIVYHD